MQPIAHVKEIWRYPVKSMGGESLSDAVLSQYGLAGDRLWAVFDEDGQIKSARQWPKLIQMAAGYAKGAMLTPELYTDEVPNVTITMPDASGVQSRCAATITALEQFLGMPCRLEPLRPPADTDFYTPPKERNRDNLNVELDKLEGEPDFDFSQTPVEMFEVLGQYMSPPGTFFDSFPLHMLSTQSVNHLADQSAADAHARRFRPNILLDFLDQSAPMPEFDLLGKRIRFGDVVVKIHGKTIRCSIPSRAQPLLGLSQDPKMTRAMVDLFDRHIGVYASIETEGEVHVGDPVFIEP